MTILDTARKILKEGLYATTVSDGQFAKLSTGLGNDERGKAVRLVLAMQAGADKDAVLEKNSKER